MDMNEDWDQVECEVQRISESKTLSRKDWEAVQAKTLKTLLEESKYNALIKKREDAGLYYKDTDFPDDPLDRGSKHVGFTNWF